MVVHRELRAAVGGGLAVAGATLAGDLLRGDFFPSGFRAFGSGAAWRLRLPARVMGVKHAEGVGSKGLQTNRHLRPTGKVFS